MRAFEIFLVALCFLYILLSFFPKPAARKASLVVAIGTGAALTLHLALEGYRWQMTFAYVLSVLCLGSSFRSFFVSSARDRRSHPLRVSLRAIGVVLLAISAALSALLPVFKLPKPDGPYLVGTHSVHFTDTEREEAFTEETGDRRELMVRFWYPAAPSDGQRPEPLFPEDRETFKKVLNEFEKQFGVPAFASDYWKYIGTNAYRDAPIAATNAAYPVVLLLHGMGTGSMLHMSQAEHLASHGYVVVAAEHTYNSVAAAFPNGRVVGFRQQSFDYADRRSGENVTLTVWTQDVEFVLRQLASVQSGDVPTPLEGWLDLNRIGAMGHSFGGAVAFHAAREIEAVKAGIDMDGSLFALDGGDEVSKPFLFMQSEDFWIRKEQSARISMTEEQLSAIGMTREEFQAVLEDNDKEYRIIENVVNRGGELMYVKGAAHYNFTDLPFFSPLLPYAGLTGDIDGGRGADIVRRHILDFFDKHLKGLDGDSFEGPDPEFPEVVFPYRS